MEPTLGSPLLGIVTELTNPTDSRASLSQDTLTLVGALTKSSSDTALVEAVEKVIAVASSSPSPTTQYLALQIFPVLTNAIRDRNVKTETETQVCRRVCFPILKSTEYTAQTLEIPNYVHSACRFAVSIMTNSNVSSIKEELCSVCLQALKSVAEDTHSDFNRRLSLLLLSQALKELSAADANFVDAVFSEIFDNVLFGPVDVMDYKTLIVTHIVSYLFDDAATQQAKLLKAWDVCKKLFKQKRDELPLAYGILCILYDRFMTPQGYSVPVDFRVEETFFDMLDYGLSKINDSLMIKRSAWLFKRLIGSSKQMDCIPPARPWTVYFDWTEEFSKDLDKTWEFFLLASDTLGEFDKHIIQPIWVQITTLLAHSKSHNSTEQGKINMRWIDLLFRRGLTHANPNVKRYCVLSFFTRFYKPEHLKNYSDEFVINLLLTASDQHHFVAGRSKPAKAAIASFLTRFYAQLLPEEHKLSFLRRLLDFIITQPLNENVLEAILRFLGGIGEPISAIDTTYTMKLVEFVNVRIAHSMPSQHETFYRLLLQCLSVLTAYQSLTVSTMLSLLRTIPAPSLKYAYNRASVSAWFSKMDLEGEILKELNVLDNSAKTATEAEFSKADLDVADQRINSILGLTIYAKNAQETHSKATSLYLTKLRELGSENITFYHAVVMSIAGQLLRTANGVVIDDSLLSAAVLQLDHPSVMKDLADSPERAIHVALVQGRLHAALAHFNPKLQVKSVNELFEKIRELSRAKRGGAVDELLKLALVLRAEAIFSVPEALTALANEQTHTIVDSLFTLELFVPSSIDSALRIKFRTFSLDFLIAKWSALSLACNHAGRTGYNPSNGLELLESVVSAAQVANRAYINNVLKVARWILPIAAKVSLDALPAAFEQLWGSICDMKEFATRRLNFFTRAIFSKELMQHKQLSEASDAPLRMYFAKIVAMGEKTLGVTNALALQCIKSFKNDEKLALLYLNELNILVTWGIARTGATDTKTAEQVETGYTGPSADFYTRIIVIKWLRTLAANPQSMPTFLHAFSENLLQFSNKRDMFSGDASPKNSNSFLRLYRAWQALIVLAPGLLPARAENIASMAWYSWDNQPQRTIRDLISLFMAILISHIPSEIDPRLLNNLKNPQDSSEEQLFLSLATCGSVLCFRNLPAAYNAQVQKIVRILIPFLTAHVASVRGTAQDVIRYAMSANGEGLRQRMDATDYDFLTHITNYLTEIKEAAFEAKRRRRELLIEHICTVSNVGQIEHQLLFWDHPRFNGIAATDITRPIFFEKHRKELLATKTDEVDEDLSALSSDAEIALIAKELDVEDTLGNKQDDFQRKIVPWEEMNLNPEGTREEAARARRPKQDIILVATLVDKIPNIAGLTRTAEIFQASQLVIGDSRVLQDHAYQVISVTADKWVPIIEVREPSLGDYLLQKKAEGYALLGAEQTATSVKLSDFRFPEKSVLLLGEEKHGIPAQYISLLDQCIEIPQLGIIRSLNVHVTGSIMLWEYTRQHALGK